MSNNQNVVEKVSEKYNESEWVIINCVELSKTEKSSKILTLKHPKNNNEFILADLRIYNATGRPTRNGVCLTEFEFDYLARVLVYAKEIEQRHVNKTGARILCIKPHLKIKGVEIIQTVNDRVRRLRLNNYECKKLINDYGSYYSIIDDCLSESAENDSEDEPPAPSSQTSNIVQADQTGPQIKRSYDVANTSSMFTAPSMPIGIDISNFRISSIGPPAIMPQKTGVTSIELPSNKKQKNDQK